MIICPSGDIEKLLDKGYMSMVKLTRLAGLQYAYIHTYTYAYLAGSLHDSVTIN